MRPVRADDSVTVKGCETAGGEADVHDDALFFKIPARFLAAIDPALTLAAVGGLVLTSLGLLGVVAPVERRPLFVEVDALLILLGYGSVMVVLLNCGIAG